MHATELLVKHFVKGRTAPGMDVVASMVDSLLRGRVLTVTGLGRSLRGEVAPKHQIKKPDRLIGNPHFHAERRSFYAALISMTVGSLKRPVVLVDWSVRRLG